MTIWKSWPTKGCRLRHLFLKSENRKGRVWSLPFLVNLTQLNQPIFKINNSRNGSLLFNVKFFKWIDFILPINQPSSAVRLFFLSSFWIFNFFCFRAQLAPEAFWGWFSLVFPIYIYGLSFAGLVFNYFFDFIFINNLIKNWFLKFYKYIHLFFNLIFMKKLFLNLLTSRLGHFLTAPVFCIYFGFTNSLRLLFLTTSAIPIHSLHPLGSNLI